MASTISEQFVVSKHILFMCFMYKTEKSLFEKCANDTCLLKKRQVIQNIVQKMKTTHTFQPTNIFLFIFWCLISSLYVCKYIFYSSMGSCASLFYNLFSFNSILQTSFPVNKCNPQCLFASTMKNLYHTIVNRSPIDEHLGDFQFLVIKKL